MLRRINVVNPFKMNIKPKFSLKRYPRDDNKKWLTIKLKDFDKSKKSLPFPFPTMEKSDLPALFDLNLGNYGYNSAPFYSLLIRKQELEPIR